VAAFTRLYPFLSGCGTLASHAWVQALAGYPAEDDWAQVTGGKLLVPLDDLIGRAAFFVGDLDRKISWVMDQTVDKGDIAVDIGANLGLVTLRLANLVTSEGRVHAFEPNPTMLRYLRTSIAHNDLDVQVHAFALGKQEENLSLYVPKKNAGRASLLPHTNRELIEVHEVPVKMLSKVASQKNWDRIDFIKIDVEGFEADVFRGGIEVLKRTKPKAILFEENNPFTDNEGLPPVMRILQELDYDIYGIPKCMVSMSLVPIEECMAKQSACHDFVAVSKLPKADKARHRLKLG